MKKVTVFFASLAFVLFSATHINIAESDLFGSEDAGSASADSLVPPINPHKAGDRIVCSFPFVPYLGTRGELVSMAYQTELEFVVEDAEVFFTDSQLRGDEDLCAFAKALVLGGSISISSSGDPAWKWCASVGELAHGIRCASAKTSPQSHEGSDRDVEDLPPASPAPFKPRGRVRVIMATAFA